MFRITFLEKNIVLIMLIFAIAGIELPGFFFGP